MPVQQEIQARMPFSLSTAGTANARRVNIPESLVTTFLYASSDCVALLDPVGQFRLVNPAWLSAMDAHPKARLRNKNWQDLWVETARMQAVGALKRAHEDLPGHFTAPCTTFKGAVKWFEVSTCPVSNAYGQLAWVLVQARDVTEAKRRETALQDTVTEREFALQVLVRQLEDEGQRLARTAARAARYDKLRFVGQFAGNIVQEFNRLLAVIGGAARALRDDASAEALDDVQERLDWSLRRGDQLVGQLHELLQVEGGDAARVDTGHLLRATAKLLPALIGSRFAVTAEADGDCWTVNVNAGRLQAVLVNLVANAVEAMDGGGRVTLAARNCRTAERPSALKAGDYVVLSVADQGCGMSAEVRARAGQAFFTTKQPAQGRGLGLAAACELAEHCGGRVAIDSEPGAGTTIRLFLPRALAVASDVAALASIAPEPHGSATLLVIDDDAMFRSSVVHMLRALNYRVIEAESTQVARAVLASGIRFQLIVASSNLIGDGGKLRAEHPTLPLIVTLGVTPMRPPSGALVLHKPVEDGLLAQAVLLKLGRVPASALSDDALLLSDRVRDRVRDRIRDPRIRNVYDNWRMLCENLSRLPSPDAAMDLPVELKDSACLLRVQGSGDDAAFVFVHAGKALIERLGRGLVGEVLSAADQNVLGSIGAAYRRALMGVAFFDYARFPHGPGKKLLFERLILPLSDDRVSVTHLVGLVTFSEISDLQQDRS
jgi:PAS domain S-box-containing protein